MSLVFSTVRSLVLTIILFCGISSSTFAQSIWYVDDSATGTNDGSDWTNAFNELQSAIAVAIDGDEIRVAGGLYKPDFNVATGTHDGDRGAAFNMVSGVSIYGGYAGYGASNPDFHNISGNVTTLSGDLAGDDYAGIDYDLYPKFSGYGDNSYHVVWADGVDSNGILDGFTIKGGNANSSSANGVGGGMRIQNSSNMVIANCVFKWNFARSGGGGMVISGSDPAINNCVFDENLEYASSAGGGGLYNSGSSPTLTGCTFSDNIHYSEYGGGGGMCNQNNSNPVLTNCTFNNNRASGEYDPFLPNLQPSGGGMLNVESNPKLTKCNFISNSVTLNGGGIANESSSPEVINCRFYNNSVDREGGGIYNYRSLPIVIGSIFRRNSADIGGGVRNRSYSPTFINCTFINNSADIAGGGLCDYSYISSEVTNCIFWGNTASESTEYNQITSYRVWKLAGRNAIDEQGNRGFLPISHCCIQGLNHYSGNGNIGDNPVLNGEKILSGSSCINAGDTAAVPTGLTVDYWGNPRIHACAVDIGAHEYQGSVTYTIFGDSDGDCIIDLDEYILFETCLAGPNVVPATQDCEEIFDGDGDGDVDLADFAMFQLVFNIS